MRIHEIIYINCFNLRSVQAATIAPLAIHNITYDVRYTNIGLQSDIRFSHTQPLKPTLLSISNEQIFGVNPPGRTEKKSEIKQRPECFPALTETLVKHLTTLCIDAAACIYKPTPPRKRYIICIYYVRSRHVCCIVATLLPEAQLKRAAAHPDLSLCQLRKVGVSRVVYIFTRVRGCRANPPAHLFSPIF